jgi:uncharacterized membrane protein
MDTTYILLVFLIVGVTFAALGVPLRLEKVRPNIWYGFRTRKTLSDERIWYPVNRETGLDMIRTGIVIIFASLVLLAVRNSVSPETVVALLVFITLASVVWMAARGFSIVKRM